MNDLALTNREYPTIDRYWPTLQAAASAPNMSRVALVPLEALPALRNEIALALSRCPRERALNAVQLMLGTYTRHEIADVEIWTRAMVSAFERYPASIAYQAVNNLTDRLRWVPVKADVIEELEKLMAPIRAADALALAMEREHQRRADDRAMDAQIEADRKRFREEHGNKSPLEVIREKSGVKFDG